MSTTISGDTGVDKFDGTTISGHVIQKVMYPLTTLLLVPINAIPLDDTIPQITEGGFVMSCSIVPKKSNSKLLVTVNTCKDTASAAIMITAVFRDSNPNAIATSAQTNAGNTYINGDTFSFIVDALSTVFTTFSVRVGAINGAQVIINGFKSTQHLGGTLVSSIIVEEIAQ